MDSVVTPSVKRIPLCQTIPIPNQAASWVNATSWARATPCCALAPRGSTARSSSRRRPATRRLAGDDAGHPRCRFGHPPARGGGAGTQCAGGRADRPGGARRAAGAPGPDGLSRGPSSTPRTPTASFKSPSSVPELPLLRVCMKPTAHSAQREYRLTLWAHPEPGSNPLDLKVSPPLPGEMQRPRREPERAGLVPASRGRRWPVEEVEHPKSSGPHIPHHVSLRPTRPPFPLPPLHPARTPAAALFAPPTAPPPFPHLNSWQIFHDCPPGHGPCF